MSGHIINGVKILVSPDHPKMQLSARVCEVLAPDFIAEINTWMVEFFGTECIIPDGVAYHDLPNNQLMVSPRTFEQLRKSVARATGGQGA